MTTPDLHVRPKIRPAALAAVAVAGAVLGTAWDLLHVRTHTTIYSIGIGRMPLWVPLEFGLAYVVGVLGIARFGVVWRDAKSFGRLAGETAWLTALYAITAFAHRHEVLVLAICAIALLARRRTLQTILPINQVPALALVIVGPAVEAILIASGVFHYTDATMGNIPLWLPLLYGNAVPLAIRLTEVALEDQP
jgi:hypothetical protein